MLSKPASAVDVFVGRLPIYTRDLEVFGYQLLYQEVPQSGMSAPMDERTSSLAFLSTFIDIGLDKIAGKLPAFLQTDPSFLLGRHPMPFSKEQLVLIIPELSSYSQELIQSVKLLSTRGYSFALVDPTNGAETRPLYELVDYVFLPFSAENAGALRESLRQLKKFPLSVIVSGIRSGVDFSLCKEMGFDYYAGDFLAHPSLVAGKRLPARRLAILQLLSTIYDPDVDYGELDDLIRRDVSLTHKLLRMINSAYFSLDNQVESIRHALVLLGLEQLRAWLSLLILADIDDKPNPLISLAMIRARMCELLASAVHAQNEERYFIVGLLSVLDAFLDQPLGEVLASLPLIDEIKMAILEHKGGAGGALKCVLAYESGNWADVSMEGLAINQVRDTYLESIAWAGEIIRKNDM